MPVVTVATWNLHHGVDHSPASMAGTWGYLRDVIRPTVALVQESDGVPATPGGSVLAARPADQPSIRFETAVVGYGGQVSPVDEAVSRYSKGKSLRVSPTVSLTHAIARIEVPGAEPFTAISVYGRIDTYAQTSVLHALADLMPLLDDPDLGRRVVLGGDLNAFDNGPSADRASKERWAAIFGLLEACGLINLLKLRREARRAADTRPLDGCRCGRGDACYHVETWRWRRDTPSVWCLDYLFVTRELASHLVGEVEVWSETRADEVWALSDHAPLVARFDL